MEEKALNSRTRATHSLSCNQSSSTPDTRGKFRAVTQAKQTGILDSEVNTETNFCAWRALSRICAHVASGIKCEKLPRPRSLSYLSVASLRVISSWSSAAPIDVHVHKH